MLFVPGFSGSNNLMPMYDRVYKEIRKIDNETIVFYEPVIEFWPFFFGTFIGNRIFLFFLLSNVSKV